MLSEKQEIRSKEQGIDRERVIPWEESGRSGAMKKILALVTLEGKIFAFPFLKTFTMCRGARSFSTSIRGAAIAGYLSEGFRWDI
jgi:hypothetical protein